MRSPAPVRALLTALVVAGSTVAASCTAAPAPPVANSIDEPAVQFGGGTGGDVIEIAFLGDSLTAGLGLLADQAYPSVIRDMFHAEGYGEVDIVNGGSSGDTTAGGLRRVDQLLGPDTRILVVALGGNDALRGLTPAQTHDNLAAILDRALEARVGVLLAGMLAPTNLGEDYQRAFGEAFVRLSREYRGGISYVPFLLEGVAGDPALNQGDGIHPNVEGARIIAELLFPHLRRMVDDVLNAAR